MTDKVPHEYNDVNLGHALGYCIHCGGTPNELRVIGDVNHCPKAAEKLEGKKAAREQISRMKDDKFVSTHKPPTGRVLELLVCLDEESHEVGQGVCKAIRFGLDKIQPDQPLTNAERVMYEVAGLCAVIDILVDEGVLSQNGFEENVAAKKIKLEKYLQHAKDS